jgi:hypothetical protein
MPDYRDMSGAPALLAYRGRSEKAFIIFTQLADKTNKEVAL